MLMTLFLFTTSVNVKYGGKIGHAGIGLKGSTKVLVSKSHLLAFGS